MRTRHLFGIAMVAVVVGLLVHFYGGSQVPSGQPALDSLTTRNVADFRQAFNAAQGKVRVLVLLSPT